MQKIAKKHKFKLQVDVNATSIVNKLYSKYHVEVKFFKNDIDSYITVQNMIDKNEFYRFNHKDQAMDYYADLCKNNQILLLCTAKAYNTSLKSLLRNGLDTICDMVNKYRNSLV